MRLNKITIAIATLALSYVGVRTLSLALSFYYPDAVLVPFALSPVKDDSEDLELKVLRWAIPPWIAATKLKITGLEGCSSSLGRPEEKYPMISGLVIVNEYLNDKEGVKEYITKYKSLNCDLNSTENFNVTPLQSAILARDVNMVHFLLSLGASIEVKTTKPIGKKEYDLNAIEYATLLSRSNDSSELQTILVMLQQ